MPPGAPTTDLIVKVVNINYNSKFKLVISHFYILLVEAGYTEGLTQGRGPIPG